MKHGNLETSDYFRIAGGLNYHGFVSLFARHCSPGENVYPIYLLFRGRRVASACDVEGSLPELVACDSPGWKLTDLLPGIGLQLDLPQAHRGSTLPLKLHCCCSGGSRGAAVQLHLHLQVIAEFVTARPCCQVRCGKSLRGNHQTSYSRN